MIMLLLKTPEIAPVWFCQELEYVAEQPDGLDWVDVWEIYCDMSDSTYIEKCPHVKLKG